VAKEKVSRLQGFKGNLAHFGSLKPRNFETWNLCDDQKEVRAGIDRVRGAGHFSLDHAVG